MPEILRDESSDERFENELATTAETKMKTR